jgi:DNA-binding NtrC family response regulator
VSGLIDLAAKSNAGVLVKGEPGTCKEDFAEWVHGRSERRAGPFVSVDCTAPDAAELEVALFGAERQVEQEVEVQRGALEMARNGTLFLAEVGALPLHLQLRVLRALDRRRGARVGGTTEVCIDARVIASTSRDLRHEARFGRFRTNLYYRLAVLKIELDPLRERLRDIPAIVASMADDLGIANSVFGETLLDREFIAKLARYSWPGNLRELRNYIERCVAFADTSTEPGDVALPPATSGAFRVASAPRSRRTRTA